MICWWCLVSTFVTKITKKIFFHSWMLISIFLSECFQNDINWRKVFWGKTSYTVDRKIDNDVIVWNCKSQSTLCHRTSSKSKPSSFPMAPQAYALDCCHFKLAFKVPSCLETWRYGKVNVTLCYKNCCLTKAVFVVTTEHLIMS